MNISEIMQTPVAAQMSLQQSTLKQMHVALPGIVHSYNAQTRTAVIAPAIRDKSADGNYVELPLLTDVPVFNPGGIFTISAGDGCLVVFADTCIDAWLELGGVQNPVIQRSHDLSDGFAFVGFCPVGDVEGDTSSIGVTDEHINDLIDAKIGVIENGTY